MNKFKLLHISNDYSGSTVYKNLVHELDKLGVIQTVYNPVREENRINMNKIEFEISDSQVIYSHILNSTTDRLLYSIKIKKILRDVKKKVDIDEIDFIHAHTWYSDGGVAYELYKTHNIPYIVTIRGSDYNYFFKYMPYLRSYAMRILQNAAQIVFISLTYRDKLYSTSYMSSRLDLLNYKSSIIPNGIDDYWIFNMGKKKVRPQNILQLLFIGRFIKDKNVDKLIKAVKKLNSAGLVCELNLVGGGKNEKRILDSIKNNDSFRYHGKIYDKTKLKKLFRQSDVFAMPSIRETFGLVYIEALSQGIPVLYTKDEGIYGYYDHIGEAVDCKSVDDIAAGILKIHDNYHAYNFNSDEIISNHKWTNIAKRYLDIYHKSL